MDTNDEYFDSLCRTCVNKIETCSYDGTNKAQRKKWLSIFDKIEECEALQIAELLTSTVPQIGVQLRDVLPKKICCECIQQLLTLHRFQQMCVKSEELLREMVAIMQTGSKVTPVECEAVPGSFNLHLQETRTEITKQIIKMEVAESNGTDDFQNMEQSLELSDDPQVDFSASIKNEPIEDEQYIDYNDSGKIHSISVMKEELTPLEAENPEVNTRTKRAFSCISDEEEPASSLDNVPRPFKVPQPLHSSVATQQLANSDSQQMSKMKQLLDAIERIEQGQKELQSKVLAMEKMLAEKMPERAEVQAQGEILRECMVINREIKRGMSRLTGDMESEELVCLQSLLPMSTEETVLKMEEHLTEQVYAEAMTGIIFQLKATKGSIEKVMQALFSDELAWHYNCNGGSGKKPLTVLKVVQMVLGAFEGLQHEKVLAVRHYVNLSHNRYKHVRRSLKEVES